MKFVFLISLLFVKLLTCSSESSLATAFQETRLSFFVKFAPQQNRSHQSPPGNGEKHPCTIYSRSREIFLLHLVPVLWHTSLGRWLSRVVSGQCAEVARGRASVASHRRGSPLAWWTCSNTRVKFPCWSPRRGRGSCFVELSYPYASLPSFHTAGRFHERQTS